MKTPISHANMNKAINALVAAADIYSKRPVPKFTEDELEATRDWYKYLSFDQGWGLEVTLTIRINDIFNPESGKPRFDITTSSTQRSIADSIMLAKLLSDVSNLAAQIEILYEKHEIVWSDAAKALKQAEEVREKIEREAQQAKELEEIAAKHEAKLAKARAAYAKRKAAKQNQTA
jgi:hypothetical protein